MTERTTDPASGHTDPKEIQQEDLELSFAASNALVQGKMADGYDERQYAINEYAECNRAHSLSPSNVLLNPKTIADPRLGPAGEFHAAAHGVHKDEQNAEHEG